METRRGFLATSAVAATLSALPGCAEESIKAGDRKMKTTKPKRALVLWYSQAGHTGRNGRLMARTLEKLGLSVTALDIRECDDSVMAAFDLIIMGTPVYYLDVPGNVRTWLEAIPSIEGIPVAAFSTFGGPGDNQYNTAWYLLELMAEKGGIPVGIATFGNMSTFAPTWSMGNEKRILKYRDLPNEEVYEQVREFARRVLRTVRGGTPPAIKKEFYAGEFLKGSFQVKLTKVMISRHGINRERCTTCGTCVDTCPVGAIDIVNYAVDRKACIACMGCVNNCPSQAVDMTFLGSRVYGFKDFLKKQGITIQEPAELKRN
ncbi:MAG TPA: EFR1 family ferrodoxin [Spirochaetota bacterium]|nr:EFR1 family ferrodoxin [Spirochaetota bacterium]HPC39714.1 EFR1 family ferrodoxin [Spirochaetota bacterium]HPL16818.1 EFR1 family ferrodoxin [Spirochaetota bacterium]HQF07442.1 EFR1 family ferrodoxin [Spirochaetota bacterium]HQH96702.1 EFR1 family ferrodoxin [Spirochaetota bacterium]